MTIFLNLNNLVEFVRVFVIYEILGDDATTDHLSTDEFDRVGKEKGLIDAPDFKGGRSGGFGNASIR